MNVKKIPGYPNYGVTDLGDVYNLKLNRKMIGHIRNGNYLCVIIHGKVFHVHRLVAELFLENPCGFSWVLHKDGDLSNNKAANLAWVPNHRVKDDYQPKAIAAYERTGERVVVYQSVYQVRHDGFSLQAVHKCLNGQAKSHAGLIWKYEVSEN